MRHVQSLAMFGQNAARPARLRAKAAVAKKPQPTDWFNGQSIADRLQNSSFGLFTACIADIKSYLPAVDFRLPQVIVVGGKSAGKSSLLEMITKCPVFPRHTEFCTKVPIKLQLQRVDSADQSAVTVEFRSLVRSMELEGILAEVDKIMKQVDSVSDDPIIIKILKADVPDFEFVDLPGIQTFPEEQHRRTTELVNKYLQADTLVLCVVDATTPALDSSLALKMVRDSGKLQHTILALTKSDLVASEIGLVVNIFDRVLRQSAENEHLEGLAGCVAVASRDCTDRISLREADSVERRVFEAMLADPAEAFAPEAVQQQLQQGMGSKQLIVRLDDLFHDYIAQHWKPAALQQLQTVMGATNESIHSLGTPVELLSKSDVLEVVQSQVHFNDLFRSFRKVVVPDKYHDKACAFAELTWGTPAWAECAADLREMTLKSIEPNTLRLVLQPQVTQAVNAVFDEDAPPHKLKRFSVLSEELSTKVLPQLIAKSIVAADPIIQAMLHETLAQLYKPSAPKAPEAVVALACSVRGCLISHVGTALRLQALQLPAEFKLYEDAAQHKARRSLHNTLQQLTNAHSKISEIDSVIAPLLSAADSPN